MNNIEQIIANQPIRIARHVLVVASALFVLFQISWAATIVVDESDLGTHALTGPVKVLWEGRYDGPESWTDHASSLAVSKDGSTVFVTGQSFGLGTRGDYSTFAYDAATGEEIWSARYDGPGSWTDYASSLALSPDGSIVYVTGSSEGSGTYSDYATLAYDAATGEEIWSARYDGLASMGDSASSLAVSPDGWMVFVTGAAWGGSYFRNDYVTLAYDVPTGEVMWIARYHFGSDAAHSLAVSPDGSTVFVTGSSTYGWGYYYDYATLAYDAATGAEIWSARYHWGEDDKAYSLAVSPDGSTVFVTGQSEDSPYSDYDYATVAYGAATGEELWSARYDGPGYGFGAAYSLAVSPDGSTVYVTGRSCASGPYSDYATLAYDAATGEEIWSARYDGLASMGDLATALAASPDGSAVFVTGASYGLGIDGDYATLAYDAATGEEIWSARYDGPGTNRDEASALAVSPDGSALFVCGLSYGVGTESDYATIAYSLVLPVEIDIMPDSINPRSDGVVPVALLGSADFDVTEVDVTTLRFGPDEAVPAHDLTDTWTYTDHLQDVNLDGFTDLMTHFWMQETGITCGFASATLTGSLHTGRDFEGADSFRTVGCRIRMPVNSRPEKRRSPASISTDGPVDVSFEKRD